MTESTLLHNPLPEMADSYQKRSDRILYDIDLAEYKMRKSSKTWQVYIMPDQILTLLYKLE